MSDKKKGEEQGEGEKESEREKREGRKRRGEEVRDRVVCVREKR